MSFADIRDQSIPLRLLRNTLRMGRVPNGFLFWGPGGVGKQRTALKLAQAINCKESKADACGVCLSCKKTANGTHPDVKRIQPSGKARLIKKESIEFINDLASYRPFEGKRRVFVLEEVDRMNVVAQNYFLKTLEEPPSETTFVLVTEHPRRLLPTIRSRCQQVRFGALQPETVAELLLQDFDLPAEVAAALAALSEGRMDRAKDLVESEKREVVLSVTQRLAEGEDPLIVAEEFGGHLKSQAEAMRASIKEAAAEGMEEVDLDREDKDEQKKAVEAAAEAEIRRNLMEYLYLLQTWYRDALVYGTTADDRRVLNRDQVQRLAAEHGAASEKKLEAIERSWVLIERNLNSDRVFRDLFLALAA